jgi:hypothetical protein
MCPTVTRSEMNNADDIMREVGLARPPREGKKKQSQIAGCMGKVTFPSRQSAMATGKHIRGRWVYHCQFCRNWHVGRSRK